jgi:hypothetical protein
LRNEYFSGKLPEEFTSNQHCKYSKEPNVVSFVAAIGLVLRIILSGPLIAREHVN